MIAVRVFALTLLVAVVALASVPAQQTEASWVRNTAARGTFTAGVTQPPGALGCSGGGTFIFGNTPPTVTFTWAAPAAPANALPVTDYAWTLTQGATVVTSGTTVPRSVAVTGNLVAVGTYTFTVVSRGPSGWNSVAGPTGTYTKTAAILGILLGTSGCSVP